MRKIVKIATKKPYRLICHFNNGEVRILNVETILDKKQKYAAKIFDEDVFGQVKVGAFGEILWENIAEIKDYNGDMIICDYDISPELAYAKSIPYNSAALSAF